MDWVILVGGGYGAFLFKGSESEAEEMRVHKARWERAVARKRPADASEVVNDRASNCLNHPGFGSCTVYVDCQCADENCVIDAEDRRHAKRHTGAAP